MSPDPEAGSRRIVVDAAAGRLDSWLAGHLPGLSRNRVAQLLAEGRILVNGSVPRKSYRPAPGDVIDVDVPPPVPSAVEAESIPLDIVYEDADLLVVNKPAGLVVHPAPGHRSGTLVNALLHHIGDLSGIGGVLRPGIVHRLDKDTSGLMIVAKNDRTHRALSAALKKREIRRVYTVAVWGHLSADAVTVDAPVGRARTDRKRMAVVPAGEGRPAVTRLSRIARWPAADLLTAELETGRTHQIRVHVAHIGHPVVGDPTYGGRAVRGISGPARNWARELDRRVGRQFLHAAELHFAHPRTGVPLSFRSPLPQDLAAAADWAAATASGG
ncbi:MAG TPA: RluA family pseudouridine synthase [Longimicrobiales bacterium]|nr:RluA family pseudouridine synthase [Longimicrobiales bacterium]